MRAWLVLSALLGGGLVLAGGHYWLTHYEPVIKDVEVGLKGEAATNDLLAAERFLTASGYPARTLKGGLELPPTDHVLVVLNRTLPLARLRNRELLGWVRRGGRLIVTPATSDESGADEPAAKPGSNAGKLPRAADPLLAELGVAMAPPPHGERPVKLERLHLPLKPVKRQATISFELAPRLVDTRKAADHAMYDDEGTFYARFRYGNGEIQIVSTARFMETANIGNEDNAAFLLWLVLGRVDPAGVELLWRDEMPSLLTLLAKYAWTALIPALLLAAALAWKAAARFGPLLPDPPEERRSLLEHLDAAGAWHWRHGDRSLLLDEIREAVHRRLEARQPAWAKLPQPELVQRLGVAASLPPQAVVAAFHGAVSGEAAAFVDAVRTLSLVRRSL